MEDGETTDLTPGVEVQGVIGASEDGEYIYYVNSADELELWHGGTSTAIAQLSEGDRRRSRALLGRTSGRVAIGRLVSGRARRR